MSTKSIITVIFSIVGFSCVFAYFNYQYLDHTQYCQSELCKRAEAYLLDSINISVDPCDNFYEFACGNWIKRHPIPNDSLSTDLFVGIQTRTSAEIADYLSLQYSEDEPQAVNEARILYRSCLAAEELNESVGFQQIREVLEQLHLPIVPLFEEPSENFSWVVTVARSKKIIDQNHFFEFGISMDPKNHTIKRFSFSKPISTGPLQREKDFNKKTNSPICDSLARTKPYNYDEIDIEDVINNDAAFKYVQDIVIYALEEEGVIFEGNVESSFREVYAHYVILSNRLDELSGLYYDKSPMLPKYMDVVDFQNITDNISECNNISSIINWKSFLEVIFENVKNVQLDFDDRDSLILIINEDYLLSVIGIISTTPVRVLEFYIWWKTMYGIIPYTTSTLNIEIDKYHNEVLGNEKRSRNLYCADIVYNVLGHAAAYFIIYDDSIKQNMKKISEMVDNIQAAFLEEIENVSWMDNETRQRSLSKLKAMKKKIGYPLWMEDRDYFDSYYENVTMNEDDFFNNVLQENKRQFMLYLEEYHVIEPPTDDWTSNPLDVNAFNNIEENAIMIPAGIFPFPFYQHGLESLNYGAIGTVIGHELTHGFDNTGKEYDDDGHLNAWWTSETRKEYENRAKCFVDQYNEFNFSRTVYADNETAINGAQTLDENIADNGGVRIAYYAYQNYIRKNGREKNLPLLDQYTNEQLFFLAFASTWCEHATSDSLKISLSDEHSPNFVRVLVTLSNSHEFSEAWKCLKGSPMNPEKNQCQIW